MTKTEPKKFKAKKPDERQVFVCTKGGTICYATIDWEEAKKYKSAFGCTIWTGVVGGFQQVEDFKAQDYLIRVAQRSTPAAIRQYMKNRSKG